MPHQCTKCGKVYEDGCKELLEGCSCSSRFFYYIRQEKLNQINEDAMKAMRELEKADKVQIEKDIREITGMEEEPDKPVILDLESVKVIEPGKFEIDIVNLFQKRRPLIYKLEEGKYIIDLASSFKQSDEVSRMIVDPNRGGSVSEGSGSESKDSEGGAGSEDLKNDDEGELISDEEDGEDELDIDDLDEAGDKK
ncbi:hypothetical protein HOD75_02090 [archaeon]|jgi:uncharacterized protein|nr:hypothetical protein [archaeon]MBT4241667.1 hypothetical protein [archaeon]MBT4418062.1 hypothetical protein [archaeon]